MPLSPDAKPAYIRYRGWVKNEAIPLEGITLIPQYSNIRTRSLVDTSTKIMPGIKMQIPIWGANMDTIMNPELAIAFAKNGAVGVLPRFNKIEVQADGIKRVKREFRTVIERPLTIPSTFSVSQVRNILDEESIGGALVKDGDGRIIGMVTMRDVILETNGSKSIMKRMIPRDKLITAPLGIDVKKARRILDEYRIEKLPLVNDEGEIVAMMTSKAILDFENNDTVTKDKDGRLVVAAAVGVQPEDMERVQELIHQGADGIVVDVAHGDFIGELEMIRKIRKAYPDAWIVGGNVATADAAKRLIKAGANAIKGGVGPGSFCTTRKVTGHGDGQLSVTIELANVTHKHNVHLIIDGGMENSGDIVKALAAGADSVMAGTLFLGSEESSGVKVEGRQGIMYKIGRGNASREADQQRVQLSGRRKARKAPEGVTGMVPYYGHVDGKFEELHQGMQSGFAYSGARNLKQLQHKALFKRVDTSYGNESSARVLEHGGYS